MAAEQAEQQFIVFYSTNRSKIFIAIQDSFNNKNRT
jgi:hypothetical protein